MVEEVVEADMEVVDIAVAVVAAVDEVSSNFTLPCSIS